MKWKFLILLLIPISLWGQIKAPVRPSVVPSFRLEHGAVDTTNTAPYLSGVSITGNTVIDSTLTFNYTFNDADGNTEDSTHVSWYSRYGTLVQYSGLTYTVVAADSSYEVYAYGTPYSTGGEWVNPGDSTLADSVGPVTGNTVPYASAVSFSGDLAQGSEFTGAYTYNDDESDVEDTPTHKWLRANDAAGTGAATIAGETNATYITDINDYDKYIAYAVTVAAVTGWTPGLEDTSAWRGPITNDVPVASTVTSTGTLAQGDVLTRSYSYADTESDAEATSTNRWFRADDAAGTNAAVIAGETGNTYTLALADYTKYIAPEITPIAATGNTDGTPVVGTYRGAVTNDVPTVSSVSVSGTKTVGQTLTGSGTYADTESDAEGTSTYDWEVADDGSGTNSAAVTDSTRISLVTDAADETKYLRFRYTPVAATGNPTGTGVWSSWYGPIAAAGGSSYNDRHFYISNDGNNTNTGTNPDTAYANTDILETNGLQAGDTVSFLTGTVLRETFTVPNSGTSDAYIVFNSHGSGDKPKILGSDSLDGFVQLTRNANVYYRVTTLTDPYTISYHAQLFGVLDNDSVIWTDHETYTADLSNLTTDYQWTWQDDTCFIRMSTDPDTYFARVEVPQRTSAIRFNREEYLEFDNLELAFGVITNFWDNLPPLEGDSICGLKITDCEIHHVGYKNSSYAYGIETFHSDAYIANNEFYDAGRRAISMTAYAAQDSFRVSRVVIEHNHFHHGWHTTGLDLNVTGDQYTDSVIFRYNYVQGSPDSIDRVDISTQGIFIANQSAAYNGVIEKVYIYNNVFTYSRGKAVILENVKNCWFANNTIYETSDYEADWQSLVSIVNRYDAVPNLNVINNIIYHAPATADNDYYAMLIDYADTYLPAMDYNLWYGNRSDARMWELFDRDGGLVVHEYNYDGWATYRSAYPALEDNSPTPADPNFLVASTDTFTLNAASSAIGAGTPLSWVTDDYFGNTRSSTSPTIGAVEYIAGPIVASAEVGTYSKDTVMVLFNESFDADSIPPESAFNLTEDGTTYGLDGIRLHGDTLFIGLDSSATYSVTYLLDYTRGYPQLQDVSGDTVIAFTDQAVTNNMPTPPTVSSAEIGTHNDTIISLVMNKALDADSVPGAASFNFTTSTTAVTIQSVTLSGSTVYLHIDDAVSGDSTLQLDYTKSAYPRLQSSVNVDAATWSDQSVTNNLPATPVLDSVSLGNVSDSTFILFFNTDLADSVPTLASFNITEGTTTLGLDSIRVTNDSIVIIGDSICVSDSAYLVDWTSCYPKIQNTNNVVAVSWSDSSVTNNITAGGYTSQYQTVLDSMTTDPTGDTLTWQNTMVKSFVDAGYWARMDRFYVHANPENGDSEALINWISPGTTNATAAGSIDWEQLKGYTGSSASEYINANYDPSSEATNLSLDDATIAFYGLLDVDGGFYDMGVGDASNQLSFAGSYNGTAYARMNNNTAVTVASTNSQGFFMATRRSSTNVEMYRNGSSLVESTSNSSVALPTGYDLNICARNVSNARTPTTNTIAIVIVMDGISDAEATAITTIVETYMDHLGTGVIPESPMIIVFMLMLGLYIGNRKKFNVRL